MMMAAPKTSAHKARSAGVVPEPTKEPPEKKRKKDKKRPPRERSVSPGPPLGKRKPDEDDPDGPPDLPGVEQSLQVPFF